MHVHGCGVARYGIKNFCRDCILEITTAKIAATKAPLKIELAEAINIARNTKLSFPVVHTCAICGMWYRHQASHQRQEHNHKDKTVRCPAFKNGKRNQELKDYGRCENDRLLNQDSIVIG